MKLRQLIGLAGVAKDENFIAQQCGKYFEIAMVIVAIWLPLQWSLERTARMPKPIANLADWIIWLFFLFESITLLSLVDNKYRYFLKNWMNGLIIIVGFPLIWNAAPLLGILRSIQLLVMLRLLLPTWDVAMNILSRNQLGTSLICIILFTTFSGVMLSFIDPAISNPWDGIWWAWQTVTTVGYGDIVPDGIAGRLLAIFLMMIGIGLVSLLTANFSAYIINRSTGELKREEDEILVVLNNLEQKIQKIEQQLQRLSKEDS